MVVENADIAQLERELKALPEDLVNVPARVELLNRIARHHLDQQDWKRMYEVAQQAIGLARNGPYIKGLARALRHSAFALYIRGENVPALKQATESLRLFQGLADRQGEADALGVMALVRWSLGAYDQALKEGLKAIRIYTELNDVRGLAWSYYAAGGLSQSLGDHNQALEYQRKALRLFEQLNEQAGLARSLTGLGSVYRALGDSQSALQHHERALDLFREAKNPLGEARGLTAEERLLGEQGGLGKAIDYHERALALRREGGARLAQVTNLIQLGWIRLRKGQTEISIELAQEACEIARGLGGKPKEFEAHQILADAYEALGDYKTALTHHRMFHKIREEVFSEERATQLKNLQISFETEKTQKEADMFRIVNEGLRAKNEQLGRLIEELHAAQAQIVYAEKMAGLGDLVAGFAHELNSPAGTVVASSDAAAAAVERLLEAVQTADSFEALQCNRMFRKSVDTLQDATRSLHAGATRISQIVRTLKSFAHLDEAAYQKTNLEEGIDNTVMLLEPRLTGRIEVVREFAQIPEVYCYAADLNQVFLNILTNAIQAIEGPGRITVKTLCDDRELVVSVTDTGRGITPDLMPNLFTPRFQRKGSRVKASMSLFTCYQIVRRHKGDIRVRSTPGQGATFEIVLPRAIENHWLEPDRKEA